MALDPHDTDPPGSTPRPRPVPDLTDGELTDEERADLDRELLAEEIGEPPGWLDEGDALSVAVPSRARYAPRRFMRTDSGNGERFAAAYGDRVRYCAPWKKWLVWDGTRWAVDARGHVMALSKNVARSIYAEAANGKDEDERREIAKWAVKSESSGARTAMLALAQSEPGIAIVHDDLDSDPWLLNTPSGTIDLRSGVLREHDRADLITKCTAASFDGAARSPLWDRVLLEAMGGDADLVAFFQRAAGYSCTGVTSEEKLFMPIGPAASGKSTLIESIRNALGDYARTADFEAFIAKQGDGGPKNEIARLAGSRLVASIEVERGKRLAQGLVKSITGGDVVSARFLYAEAFEFRPTFKLWLVANDAPRVTDDDDGMWRRIVRIPFAHVVPPEKRDPNVKAELVDVARSGGAILRWLVDGCLMWQAKGLGVPSAVTRATDDYRTEQDPLAGFLAECCTLAPASSCSRKELRTAYEAWVDEAGGRTPMTGQDFSARVRRVPGVGEWTKGGVRGWSGIATPYDRRTNEREDER